MCQPLIHQSCDLGQVFRASASTSRDRDDNSSDLNIAARTRQVQVHGTKDAFQKCELLSSWWGRWDGPLTALGAQDSEKGCQDKGVTVSGPALCLPRGKQVLSPLKTEGNPGALRGGAPDGLHVSRDGLPLPLRKRAQGIWPSSPAHCITPRTGGGAWDSSLELTPGGPSHPLEDD